MSYQAKTDWVDFDESDPTNPNAIPKAADINRIEQGIKDNETSINLIDNKRRTTEQIMYSGWRY